MQCCRPARPCKMTGVAARDAVGMRGSGHQMADGLPRPCWFPPFLLPRTPCHLKYFFLAPFSVFPVIFCSPGVVRLTTCPHSLPDISYAPSRTCIPPCLLKKGSSSWGGSTSTRMSRHLKTTSAALGQSLRVSLGPAPGMRVGGYKN